MNFTNNIEDDKNEFNNIYDELVKAIEDDIKTETEEEKKTEENKIKNQNNSSYDDLKENSFY